MNSRSTPSKISWRMPSAKALTLNVWAEMTTAADYLPFTNWYGIATTRSHHFAPIVSNNINLPL